MDTSDHISRTSLLPEGRSGEILALTWVDYALFGIMFAISVVIGLYYGCCGSKQATTKDYLLGGRSMGFFPIAMSISASYLSGTQLLGLPAEIYMFGTQQWACVISALLVYPPCVHVFFPVFYKLKLTSSYEYLLLRFDAKIRNIVSVVFLAGNIFTNPLTIYVPALAFNQVSGMQIEIIAPIVCLVCIFYTTIGGLKAVVWSDTIQLLIILGSMFAIFYIGVDELGGFTPIWERAEEGSRIDFFNLDPDPTSRTTFWGITIGMTVMWVSHCAVQPAVIQRFLSLPCYSEAKKTMVLFVILTIVIKSVSCFSGLIIYAYYHGCDPLTSGRISKMDQLLPHYVLDVAKDIPGLAGIFMAGVFCAALSTMSTNLNTLSGIILEDFIKPISKKKYTDKSEGYILKSLVVVVGLVSLGIVFLVEKMGGILQVTWSFAGVTGGPVLGVFILGMLFPKSTSLGALWGIISSFIAVIIIFGGQQYYIINKAMPMKFKPLSVANCSSGSGFVMNGKTVEEAPFPLFGISFHWYALIGMVVCLLVGGFVSWLKPESSKGPINRDLFSPVIHRFLHDNTDKNCNQN